MNPIIYYSMNKHFREIVTKSWRSLLRRGARKLGLPDPVAAYDRRAALRSVAPTGHTGPATVASSAGTFAAPSTEEQRPHAPLVPLRTAHEASLAPGSVDLVAAYSFGETGPGSSSPQNTLATAGGVDASSTPSLTSKRTTYMCRTSQKTSVDEESCILGGMLEMTTVSSAVNMSSAAYYAANMSSAAMSSAAFSSQQEIQEGRRSPARQPGN